MNRSVSLLLTLLLSSMVFAGMATAQGQVSGSGKILSLPAETAAYCHMTFPAARDNDLSRGHPDFVDGAVYSVDHYRRCDYDPLGIDEITQSRVNLGGTYGETE